MGCTWVSLVSRLPFTKFDFGLLHEKRLPFTKFDSGLLHAKRLPFTKFDSELLYEKRLLFTKFDFGLLYERRSTTETEIAQFVDNIKKTAREFDFEYETLPRWVNPAAT